MRCSAPDQVVAVAPPARGLPGARVELGVTVVALAIVVWFYAWTTGTEGAFEAVTDGDYYHAVVQGWRSGHVHLSIEPRPEMLRLANPYDPAQNGPYRLPDASFYRGHYYLYFGAAPALTLMLPYAVLTGGAMNTATAAFVFCASALVLATGLLVAVRRRYFPEAGAWVVPLGVLTLGFATHFLALARRPMWWELPIAAEVTFFLAALAGWYVASHTTSGGWRVIALAGAGLSLGLAVASRPTALFGIAGLVPAAAYAARHRLANERSWRWAAVAAASALAGCAVAIGAYNQARFGSPFEFGQKYQLSGMYEGQLRHFATDFVRPNFATYFLQPLKWDWEFPYAHLWTRGVGVRDYVDGEELSGLVASFPVLLLALGVPLAGRRRHGEPGPAAGLVLPLLGYFAGVATILHCFFSATERYAAEFGFAFGLLAVVGWLSIECRVRPRWARGMCGAIAGLVALVSVASGVLVSFDYHGGLLQRDDPPTWQRLERRGANALGRLGLRLGEFSGPRVLKVRFADRPEGTIETFWQSDDAAAAERVLVRHGGRHEITFGFARGGESVQWGRRLTWVPQHTHTVEVQVPSLYGPADGWMRGLRSSLEFRERSSVAVWFSGGRVLELLVPRLAVGFTPGGKVGTDFSGEVKRMRTRLFRDDEVGIGSARPAGDQPVGGILRLRVWLPDELAPAGEPLLTMGARYGSDMVFLREGNGGVCFGLEHFGEPAVLSAPVPLDRRREHVIAIELPSCRHGAFGAAARGAGRVSVDGKDVLRRDGGCFGFDAPSVGVGANAFGTTCAARFRGWITSASWTSD